MKATRVHLLAGTVVFALACLLTLAGVGYARRVEDRHVDALSGVIVRQALVGEALSRAALRQDDLLVAYGSSELVMGSRDRANRFFQRRPTGFNVFALAHYSRTCLLIAQDLAADGEALRGKKVVVSFTPTSFTERELGAREYAGNYSHLHAAELTFSSALSMPTKQRAVRRMLLFQAEKDPFLRFAQRLLARQSPLARALYWAIFPLGRLDVLVLRLQDHWQSLADIRGDRKVKRGVKTVRQSIDWPAREAEAERNQIAGSQSNAYGIADRLWARTYRSLIASPVAAGAGDAEFLRQLGASPEWEDLDIVLNELRELGARPLILSRPINGPLYDALGISSNARRAYYEKLRRAVAPYQAALVDFADHDEDRYFSSDRYSHASEKGWLYVDEVLDRFYRGELR